MGTWVVLVCAVLASLAIGVLTGYVICKGMFGLFRVHARNVATAAARHSTQVARS
ncbi:MAG: hypothetical protein ACYC46_06700 [Acidobacteriaceae bacterium]